jgi:6-phosphofructokinase 1
MLVHLLNPSDAHREGANMKRMAVLTSGGDAPGMNAVIRSVVRIGIDKDWQVLGIRHGYAGLITDNVVPLGARDVSGIIQQGGTILGSARCPEFKTEDARLQALHVLRKHEIETVVIIGAMALRLARMLCRRWAFR